MKIFDLVPFPNEKLKFTYQEIRTAPETKGCYVLTNYHHDIIYIGRSVNLHQRALQHFDNDEKRSITKLGKTFWYFYIQFLEDKHLPQTERGWLNQYELEHGELPPLNKIHASL